MIFNKTKRQIKRAKHELAEYIAANDGKKWEYINNYLDVDYKSITLTINNVNGIVRVLFPQVIDIWDENGCPVTSLTINERPE